MDTQRIINALSQQRNRISQAISALEGTSGGSMSANHTGQQRRGRRRLSAEARSRIAAAQRRRWAAVKAAKKK